LQDAPPHPYAGSKAVAESVIEWEARRGRLACAVLRLFNAAGGQDPDSTRIVPRVLAVAAGETPQLAVNGDGSATRDYLHFQDAAEAFVAALERGPELGTVRRYNIGSGTGTSIADVISAAERVTGRTIPVLHKPPAAEPPMLVCDPSRAQAELGWKPRRSDVDTIVRGAWAARG
jgi:UDP-glucose 4-epimerase